MLKNSGFEIFDEWQELDKSVPREPGDVQFVECSKRAGQISR